MVLEALALRVAHSLVPQALALGLLGSPFMMVEALTLRVAGITSHDGGGYDA